MKVPEISDHYTEADFDLLGFHDCRVSGIKWDDERFTVGFALDYIFEWVQPSAGEQSYRFWICPAELWFENVDDVKVVLDWAGQLMECRLEGLHRKESRRTPNGQVQSRWEFEFTAPKGDVSLWATGFELRILGPPALCNVQRLSSQELKRGRS
jgi:hypothetical protein